MKNIFSGFKTWLRRQPRNREFLYSSPTECVLATFLKSKGELNPHVGPYDVCISGANVRIPQPIVRAFHKGCEEDLRRTGNRVGAKLTPKLVLKHLP